LFITSEKYSAKEEFGGRKDQQLIGCFAAASRLNGVIQNDLEITALLHIHGALAFWDYSSAGPYCVINMNPEVLFLHIYYSLHFAWGRLKTSPF
jgi:selenocysteine lyase/cysteine desulfurase